jgi:superfamily I DNA/RNA helicase
VARPLALLEAEPAILAEWRAACAELLVDEVQDVDRSQLELALLLAAPANRIFLVGDDDDPDRALEEERRVAYVAWTRARRSLTLVYAPAAPSSFLLEAFREEELTATT